MIHALHLPPGAEDIQPQRIEALMEQMRAEHASGKVGYYDLSQTMQGSLEQIRHWITRHPLVKNGELTDVVVLGIGGSSLGPKAVDAMLAHLPRRSAVRLSFLENLDPVATMEKLKAIHAKRAIFLVVSKSGSTIETVSLFKVVLSHSGIDVAHAAPRIAYITDAGSALDKLGKHYGVEVFEIPHNVGGRFSVLSPVGLLPLALVGYRSEALLAGAGQLLEQFWRGDRPDILQKALWYADNAQSHPMSVLFSYASSLAYFNAWFVQLWGESLGKIRSDGNRMGLTPIGLVGSVDQHSFLQLLMEGPRDKAVTFVKVRSFGTLLSVPDISIEGLEGVDFVNGHPLAEVINAQADATREALVSVGVPTDLLEIDAFDEETVGAMIAYFELLTTATGMVLGINPYDQPGVETGKKILVQKFR